MNSIKPFIGIGAMVLFLYLCWELVPPFFNNYQFQDFLETEARESTYAYNKTEEAIRNEVFQEAQKNSIPITPDQIRVIKTGTEVSLAVDYTVHVDLPFAPQDFHFSAASKNRNLSSR